MVNGRSRIRAGRHAGDRDDIGDYYLETDAEDDMDPAHVDADPSDKTLSTEEEIRRLKAYVAHLKQQLDDMRRSNIASRPDPRPNNPTARWTPVVLAGIALVLSAGFVRRRG